MMNFHYENDLPYAKTNRKQYHRVKKQLRREHPRFW